MSYAFVVASVFTVGVRHAGRDHLDVYALPPTTLLLAMQESNYASVAVADLNQLQHDSTAQQLFQVFGAVVA